MPLMRWDTLLVRALRFVEEHRDRDDDGEATALLRDLRAAVGEIRVPVYLPPHPLD